MDSWRELREIKEWALSLWSRSLGFFIALVLGFLLGFLIKGDQVVDDCKYMKNFRIGNQSFGCERRI